MPVSFQIIRARGLTIVTHTGFVTIEETIADARRYAAHPDYRPDQKFLFDTTRLTGFERDYLNFFRMQGRMVELFAQTGREQLIGCLAPHDIGQDWARFSRKSSETVDTLVILVHHDEGEVLAFLGQPERSIAAMLGNVGLMD